MKILASEKSFHVSDVDVVLMKIKPQKKRSDGEISETGDGEYSLLCNSVRLGINSHEKKREHSFPFNSFKNANTISHEGDRYKYSYILHVTIVILNLSVLIISISFSFYTFLFYRYHFTDKNVAYFSFNFP